METLGGRTFGIRVGWLSAPLWYLHPSPILCPTSSACSPSERNRENVGILITTHIEFKLEICDSLYYVHLQFVILKGSSIHEWGHSGGGGGQAAFPLTECPKTSWGKYNKAYRCHFIHVMNAVSLEIPGYFNPGAPLGHMFPWTFYMETLCPLPMLLVPKVHEDT